MQMRYLLCFLALAQCAKADIFIIELTDTSGATIINTTGTRCNGEGDCILQGPAPGVFNAFTGTLPTGYLFGEPGNSDNVGAFGHILQNDTIDGSQTEIYVPDDPAEAEFFDYPPTETCSTESGCIPAQNGTEYYLGDINYTDGSTDYFYFEWLVTGEAIVAPEPASLLLLATIVLALAARKRLLEMSAPARTNSCGLRVIGEGNVPQP